ncbi:MAG: DinB family protein [Lewinellaceae bacterium]|nr:DinB family protein [Lewinellaceae bacterium]
MPSISNQPLPGEYPPYSQRYIELVPEEQIVGALVHNKHEIEELLLQIPDDKWDFRYAPEKWTLKEAVIHVLDTERIMAYRALRMSRHDPTPLAGFEQDDFIPYVHAEKRSPMSIREEWNALRDSSIHVFMYLEPDDLSFIGTAAGYPFSVRALGYFIAGHARYHERIIRERYLV